MSRAGTSARANHCLNAKRSSPWRSVDSNSHMHNRWCIDYLYISVVSSSQFSMQPPREDSWIGHVRKKATIYDLSVLSGSSPSTVSAVLNGTWRSGASAGNGGGHSRSGRTAPIHRQSAGAWLAQFPLRPCRPAAARSRQPLFLLDGADVRGACAQPRAMPHRCQCFTRPRRGTKDRRDADLLFD